MTLSREKCEEAFYQLQQLSSHIALLGGVVQNPDFVNEDNAQDNYENFYNDYKSCKRKLDDISDEIYNIYKPLIK